MNLRRNLQTVLITVLAFAFLVGCAAPAGPAPAETQPAADTQAPPPAPTDTSPPPTAAPTPTAEPTGALVEPTPTVKPTNEPLPEISLETLLGLWTQYDDDAGGYNWLAFFEDGTYQAKHGPSFETGIGILVSEGAYLLEEDVLTIMDADECPEGETYQLSYRTSKIIRFDPLSTTCDFLADDFEREPLWEFDGPISK
jgi:hypothetical protein